MPCGTILVTISTGGGGTTSGGGGGTIGTSCVNGATNCSGTSLMTCVGGVWNVTTPNSVQCGYKPGGGTTTSGTGGGGTTSSGATASTCDGLNRNGSFDYTCLFEPQNQNLLIALGAGVGPLLLIARR